VNADGVVTPLDGLLVLTELNAAGSYSLTGTTPGTRPPLFFDVSGDRHLAPLDALLVINYLNAGGEGELPEPEPPAEEVDASADYLSRSPHFSATWLLAWQELEHNARKSMNNQFKSGG
jgi:hypothetical protein